MSRSSRLFEIIQILRCARAPIPARTIAVTLEVAKRTIYRDIASLQAMQIPIEGAAGLGYLMRPGYDLPPLMLTAEEVEAIVVGLSLLGRTRDAALQRAASRVVQKIADVLPNSADARVEGSPLYVSHWNSIPTSEVDLHTVRKAIREEQKLRFLYQDVDMHSTERTVRPIALVYYVDSVILAAWCELREDFRHFRVDRISACAEVEAHFKGAGEQLRKEWRGRHELFPA